MTQPQPQPQPKQQKQRILIMQAQTLANRRYHRLVSLGLSLATAREMAEMWLLGLYAAFIPPETPAT